MQIISLETNTSSAFPQRKRQPSLMSRVKLEYSYLFPSAETIEWFPPLPVALPCFSLLPLGGFSVSLCTPPHPFIHRSVYPSLSPLSLFPLLLRSLSSWNVAINRIGRQWCWQSRLEITPRITVANLPERRRLFVGESVMSAEEEKIIREGVGETVCVRVCVF